jgi:hypothetical protein
MAKKRIGRNLRPYFDKARDSALLAVEVYNKPAVAFRSSAYISLMVIAWTALLHAIFLRRRVNPYYKHKNGRYQKVDGDFRHWELTECVRHFWDSTPNDPVRKNLEFFIPLRNKIEHRHLPELDSAIFGECQAMLLNFDSLLGKEFGTKYQLRESLSFSLQLFPSGASFAQAVTANRTLEDIKSFIDNYRSTIGGDIQASGQFAFKAFLIQISNYKSKDALPIQFVQYEKLTDAERADVEKVVSLVKFKQVGVANAGLLRPAEVVRAVREKLAPSTNGGSISFTSGTHTLCWKHYNVRPRAGATSPELTNSKYCVFDRAHRDYLYTQDWVELLVQKMVSPDERAAIAASKPAATIP